MGEILDTFKEFWHIILGVPTSDFAILLFDILVYGCSVFLGLLLIFIIPYLLLKIFKG